MVCALWGVFAALLTGPGVLSNLQPQRRVGASCSGRCISPGAGNFFHWSEMTSHLGDRAAN